MIPVGKELVRDDKAPSPGELLGNCIALLRQLLNGMFDSEIRFE